MILPVHHEAPIPAPAQDELRAHPQWVCWRVEERNGKPTKVPYNPRIGQLARSNDPTTWGSYQHACEAWQREPERYQGVGFMFQQDYTGIDLDHCVRADGSIDPWARVLVEQLATYTEYSPNDGLHLFLRGTIPTGIRRRVTWAGRSDAAFEMYCQGRYFTVTGHQVPGTSGVIAACDEKLQEIVADLTILDKAHNAKNGETFRALWRGETAGYVSASEADLALCNLLAFWTNCDPERMDRLFRQSGLYRPEKWDRSARAGETYGQGTIARARVSLLSKERSATGRLVELPTKGIVLSFPTRTALAEDTDLQALGDLPQPDLAFIMDCLFREEEGDARLYAFLFQGRCIYDHTEGMWYEWQGHVWKRDEQKHALKLVSNLLASVYLQASALLSQQAADQARQIDPDLKDEKTEQQKEAYSRLKKETATLIERARKLKMLKRIEHVLTLAQAHLPITSKAWDRQIWLLACANGVLDLRTGQLHPGKPEDYLRSAIPTEWRGLEEPAPRWEQFLREVFDDRDPHQREALIAFLQRLLGYGITGDVSEHVFLVLYGEEGRNGKDTIQRAISTTLGEISSAISKDVLLEAGRARTAGSATPHICDLQGKRLAWASEPEKGARFSVSQVKEYSGGGEIASRGMYEKTISKIKPTHLLILLTNHKPYADSDDKAFWDRLRLVNFNLRFVDVPTVSNERKKDTKLWQALEAEASGILAWLTRGCLEWQQRGLDTPQELMADGEQYRREQDALDLFLSACCELDPQAIVRANILYQAYVEWGKANNLRNLLTGTSFGKKVAKRFVKKHTERGAAYQGLRLLESEGTPTLFGDGKRNESTLTGLTASDGLSSKPVSLAQAAWEEAGDPLQKPLTDGLTGLYGKSSYLQKIDSLEGISCINPSTRQPVKNISPPPACGEASEADELDNKPVRNSSDPSATPSVSWPKNAEFVRTIHGLAYRTSNRQEKDVSFIAPERKEALRYAYGAIGLLDGIERFYYPRMLTRVSRQEVEIWLAEQKKREDHKLTP